MHNCQFEPLSSIHVISVIKCFNVQPHGKSWKIRQNIVLALSRCMYLRWQNGAFLRVIFFVNLCRLCIHAQIDLCKRVLDKYFVSIWCQGNENRKSVNWGFYHDVISTKWRFRIANFKPRNGALNGAYVSIFSCRGKKSPKKVL